VAVLASIGAGAWRGLLINSEHPLAEAVRAAARARGASTQPPEVFEALPGVGVRARVSGRAVSVVKPRAAGADPALEPLVARMEAGGGTVLLLTVDGTPAALLAATDTARPEVPAALDAVRALGVRTIELLTGDNDQAAATLATCLGISHRANLLPEDTIATVQAYQRAGRTVLMVGDGVDDAPALARADIGIAMGAAGTDVAADAAHVVLMRDDWRLVPAALAIARRTMRVVKLNIGFRQGFTRGGHD
jgi:Cd2+/Zn2+-exporting ATPase/Cu+-exporting ATPase